MIYPLLALSALLAVSFAAEGDDTATTDTVSVDFMGASGGFKIYFTDSPGEFVQVSQSGLREIDANGSSVGGTFSPAPATWGDGVSTVDLEDGNTAYTANYYKTKENGNHAGVELWMKAWISETSTEVFDELVNDTVTLTENQLKFSVKIAGWEFENPNNTLAYTINVEANNQDDEDEDEDAEDEGEDVVAKTGGDDSFSFGSHVITAPTTAEVDGEVVDISVTVTDSGLEFVFPSFEDSLVYDPDVLLYVKEPLADVDSGSLATPLSAVLFLLGAFRLF